VTLVLGAWTSYVVLAIIILVVLVLAVAVAILRKTGARIDDSPYDACPPLTPAERSFWQVLQQCLPDGYVLLAKVRLADIVNVKKGFDAKTRQAHFNRISRKHADFVICDAVEMMPRAVIKLDDASHQARRSSERDEQKDRIIEGAGIRLLRIRAQRAYDTGQLRESLLTATARRSIAQPLAAQIGQESEASRTDDPTANPATPNCPKCGSVMVLRVAKQGANKGGQFWGCGRYPHCKGILIVD